MNCDEARNQLPLYLYGELDFHAEESIEQHLDGCPACRESLERERLLHAALDQQEWQPSAELLLACRRELRSRAGQMQANASPSVWLRARQFFTVTLLTPAWYRPIAAVALVAAGFFGGRLWDATRRESESPVVRVRNLNATPEGGVQLVLEEVRQRTMRGHLDDDRVRQMLLAAAADPSDPALRARTLDILKERGERVEIRQALLQALERDTNPGVRLKAIDGLKPFAADPDTRRAIARVLLADENPGVRTQAIDLLVQNIHASEVIGTLQELILRESNPYIRQKSLKALREANASVETF
jgi:hypothetical protein